MPTPFTLRRRSVARTLVLAAAGLLSVSAALAQSWPTAKPITLVVGYPPGGSVDLVARIVAEPLAKRLGTPVVVENVGGAGGTIGAQRVVGAAPNGYTLLLGSGSEVSIARLFNPAVKYNGETDLTAVSLIGVTPMVFVTNPKTGVKTIDEAIAKSRREPNQLSFASSGIGTPLHVSGELINLLGGSSFRHVPYRGAGQQVQDLLGGNVDFSVSVLSSALPYIESGKMVALGVTTPTRSRAAPQIPALGESPRLKGYDMNVWFGLFGPAKLPAPMVARLNKELNDVLREEAVWQKLQKAGISNEGGTPQALSAFIKAETQRVRSVGKAVSSGSAS
ncbi:Bug family tripartite tricarboxylate transporter substrate binding protein [Polaromonas jejuensis]|uniref:Bug family tripartite tricarboxylate transporter substrate binding protein n=1 Tax=Polaromonas jejuensis TaxID=457502 RepID=A0ABW0QAJ3_9BURK|nr:tripartite tricarboxylate transporter substrate binding protein [Polaromonas jejuensis]